MTPPLSDLVEPSSPIDDAESYVRQNVTGYAHAVGTCRMGLSDSDMTVAAGSGKVIGTENIWVCDGSAIPIISTANTNLSCMLVGWRVAQAIAQAGSTTQIA